MTGCFASLSNNIVTLHWWTYPVTWLASGRLPVDDVKLERALDLGCDLGFVLALLLISCVIQSNSLKSEDDSTYCIVAL